MGMGFEGQGYSPVAPVHTKSQYPPSQFLKNTSFTCNKYKYQYDFLKKKGDCAKTKKNKKTKSNCHTLFQKSHL